MNTINDGTVPDVDQVWPDSFRDAFPGGVKVILVLCPRNESGVYLMSFNKHSHMLPTAYLAEGECPVELARKLAPEGSDQSAPCKEVGRWVNEAKKTLHLVFSVVLTSTAAASTFVPREKPYMLGTLADNELSDFLTRTLFQSEQPVLKAA